MTYPDPRAAETARALAKQRANRSQRLGNDFELTVINRLKSMGFVNVEKRATPKNSFMRKGTNTMVTRYNRKVSGDIDGVEPTTGKAMKCECKWRSNGYLSFRDLKKHQHESLSRQGFANGLALIAWGHSGGITFLDYAKLCAAGFQAGYSLTPLMIQAAAYVRRM